MQNILESQVSDLASLANSPIAGMPGGYDMDVQHQRHSSSAESPAHDNGKRKLEENGQNGSVQHVRVKRNRYISIACNECKRRKIKCNGNTPCHRCGNLKLECLYAPNCCSNGFKDSGEFREMNAQIASLQDQVNDLYSNLNALRARESTGTVHPPQPKRTTSKSSLSQFSVSQETPTAHHRSVHKHPRFQGPTSSAFSLDVAKNTLHNMGYQSLAEEAENEANVREDTPQRSPALRMASETVNPWRDPVWSVDKGEAIRLCRLYDEEMGLMNPVVNIEEVIEHSKRLFRFMETAISGGLQLESPSAAWDMRDENANILKMVMATALTVEGSGQSELGNRLYESVKGEIGDLLHCDTIEIKSLSLLVLVAIFHFHRDEEALAWRIIGQVARMCIEIGLHRRDALEKSVPDEEERAFAINVFWSVYVLDRRWSFGTGMPFAIQDSDVDPTLPQPELAIPYLNVMIAYSRLGSKVWRSVAGFEPEMTTDLKKQDIGYLDYQIVQWQKSIPSELQLPVANAPPTSSRAIQRLQILLYLRANQMRILIYRPVLHSANSIMENLTYAQTVVDLAKDTIRALTHLSQTSDIYHTQQVCFNYFLVSALAVLFLASCHAPVQFSEVCRDEFYMALDLVKGFSSKSHISKRLWRTIKGLKEVAPKLGLSEDNIMSNARVGVGAGVPVGEDPHSSAALAMAGLAGHEISDLGAGFLGQQGGQDRGGSGALVGSSPMNGFQMSHEMTSLFEAALGNSGAVNASAGYSGNGTGMQDANGEMGVSVGGGANMNVSNMFGSEEELYKQMRDLF